MKDINRDDIYYVDASYSVGSEERYQWLPEIRYGDK